MFSEVDNWFYKYLGGICYEGGKLTINPYRVSGINEVEVTRRDVTVKIKDETLCVTLSGDAKVIWNGKEYNVSAGTHNFC